MAQPTIAIVGPNGNVGSATRKYLARSHQRGDIKLVLLTRPGSAQGSTEEGEWRELIGLEIGSRALIGHVLVSVRVVSSTEMIRRWEKWLYLHCERHGMDIAVWGGRVCVYDEAP